MPFLRLLARLPWFIWYALAAVLFGVLRLGGYRRQVALDNLAASFPHLDAPARARLLGEYQTGLVQIAVETIKGLSLTPAQLAQRMVLEGLEELQADLAAGRSVLLATGHCANWEWLLLALSAQLPVPMDALYKPLKSPLAERFFQELRGRFGARLIPAKDVLAHLKPFSESPRVLAMVADQVPASTTHRYWTRFLNQDTAFYLGLDDLARATGAPVYVVFAERLRRGHYRARVQRLARPRDESLAAREISARYVERLEQHLMSHPAQWLWGHRRWKLKKPLYGR